MEVKEKSFQMCVDAKTDLFALDQSIKDILDRYYSTAEPVKYEYDYSCMSIPVVGLRGQQMMHVNVRGWVEAPDTEPTNPFIPKMQTGNRGDPYL